MLKVYYLSTCSTCKRIMKSLNIDQYPFEKQDIKSTPITLEQIEEMRQLSGSYLSLFSKRSRQYAALNLKDKNLSEDDIKALILKEYTFLKRPVFLINNQIFIGNSAKNVIAVENALENYK